MFLRILPNRFWLAPVVAFVIAGAVAALTLGKGYSANMSDSTSAIAATDVSGYDYPISGPIQQYWSANGGEARFGKPLTGVFATYDGYAAQWFERAALTYEPGAIAGQSVTVPNVGWIVSASHCTETPFTRVSAASASRFFPETGHNLSGKFLDRWNSQSGLQSYGYPLSEPFRVQSGGATLVVQYFERARLEMPASGGAITLGLLGVEARKLINGSSPAQPVAPDFYPPSGTATSNGHRAGHAPDYSWVAGRIGGIDPPVGMGPRVERPTGPVQLFSASNLVMKILEAPTETALPNGARVGTSVHNDVSRPLRDIMPRLATPECSAQAGDIFLPVGAGWNPAGLKDGDHVVLYGHLAAPGEAPSSGDRGRPYVVDRVEAQGH